jgi:hypothetical protein
MPHSLTLPLVAGLAIIGTAVGVSLGRSAVNEINPAYFTDPQVPFHADLSPYRTPDWAQVQSAEYQRDTIPEGLGTGCIGCTAAPALYLPDPQGWSDGLDDGRSASAAYAIEPEPAPTDPVPRDAELERIDLYASYPVDAAEAAAGTVLALAATE